MRQSNKMGRDWLRAVIIAGCIPVGSSVAQDRFIHQPKPVNPAPQQVPSEQLAPVKETLVKETSAKVPSTASQYTAIQPPSREETPRVQAILSSAPQGSGRGNESSSQQLVLNEPEPGPLAVADVQPLEVPSVPAVKHPASHQSRSPAPTFRPVQSGAFVSSGRSHEGLAQQVSPQPLVTHPDAPQGTTAEHPSRRGLQWVAKGSTKSVESASDSTYEVATRPEFAATPTASHDFPSLSANYPTSQQAYRAPEATQSQQRFSEMETRMQELEAKFTEALAEREHKPTVATLVSSRIVNDPRYKVDAGERRVISPVETPTGWQAIGQQLTQRLNKCESLLGRGAFYSAREEAQTATLILLRHLDVMDNSYRCEPTLAAAHQAMREAEDFVAAQRSNSDTALVKRLIDAHETPLLKGVALEDTSPATAAQHYRQHAEQLLAQAALNHPWASELYYTTGRAYQAEADVNKADSDSLRARALCYYRAARITLPTNAMACNQLGFLLLQMDRPADAREAIVAALAQRGDTAFLSNLAEASRRLGDTATQQWALQTVASRNASQPPVQKVPQVLQLTPAQFAELSPYASSPNVGAQPPATEAAPPAPMHRTATAPMSSNLR